MSDRVPLTFSVTVLTAFPSQPFYNSHMIILRAPSGASDALAHAVELTNRDLAGWLDKLDTTDQEHFWTDLKPFAAGKRNAPGRNVMLSFNDAAPELVREGLHDLGMKMTEHLREMPQADQERFWEIVREAAEQQAGRSRQPQPRL